MTQSAPLSPEVEWYLESRGYELPRDHAIPLWRTEEPGDTVEGAVFSAERVDKVIKSLRVLRHTKGRWAGQPLEPAAIQVAYFIAPIFGWIHKNEAGNWARVVQEVYIEMPRKGAKALELSTPLLTQRGWVPVSDVEAGDSVYGPDGQLTEITATSEVFHDRELFKVTTSDGRTLIVDGDHLWSVYDRSRRKSDELVTMTTNELLARGVKYSKVRPANRFVLPCYESLMFEKATFPVDPYILGYWLGDGFSGGGRFAVGDEDIEQFEISAARAGYTTTKARDKACWRVSVAGLAPKLKVLGLLNNKHIPESYLRAAHEDRLALLQGLMDSDGTSGNRGHVSYTGCNESLVQSVLWLVRSLGIRANIGYGDAKIDGRTVGQYHRVFFTGVNNELAPFRLPRKLAKLPGSKADSRRRTLTIKSIEPAGRGDARCIKVAREDGLFLAGRDLVVTHNTTLASGLGMYLAFADDEAGAEVVFGAASKDQAGAAFRPVEALARSSRHLKQAGIVATKSLIEQAVKGSSLKAVSSRGDLAHGANIHGALIDELHVHKNGDLLEAIETGTGAREQPLTIIITTADDGQTTSVYAQRRLMIEQVCAGILKQPTTYAVIFAAVEGVDDPFSEETWRRVNPLYPETPSPEFMRKAASKAKASPVAMASFLRLHLGIRAKQGSRFIDADNWRKNQLEFKESMLYDRVAYGGLDLSSVSDLTALTWLFPDADGGHTMLNRLWLPEAALAPLDKATNGMASAWVLDGWITLTPGDVVDYNYIRAVIQDDATKFRVREIGYDRWNASQLVIDLQEKDGMNMVKVGQGIQSMNPALREMDRLIKLTKLRGNNNPVMAWMADNLRVAMDPAGNIKPDKAKSTSKIDGISATLNAIFSVMTSEEEMQTESAYENGHLETV